MPSTRDGKSQGSISGDNEGHASISRDVAIGLITGAVAGAVGVWVMDRADWLMYRRLLDTAETRRQTEAVRPGGMDPAHVIANWAARALGVDAPRPAKQNAVGLAVHYGLGMAPGAVYGALRGRVSHVDAAGGLVYGLALFLLEDELANPVLGFAAPPRSYPWQAHARGLVSHLILGAVTDLTLQALTPRGRRRRMPRPPVQRNFGMPRQGGRSRRA